MWPFIIQGIGGGSFQVQGEVGQGYIHHLQKVAAGQHSGGGGQGTQVVPHCSSSLSHRAKEGWQERPEQLSPEYQVRLCGAEGLGHHPGVPAG